MIANHIWTLLVVSSCANCWTSQATKKQLRTPHTFINMLHIKNIYKNSLHINMHEHARYIWVFHNNNLFIYHNALSTRESNLRVSWYIYKQNHKKEKTEDARAEWTLGRLTLNCREGGPTINNNLPKKVHSTTLFRRGCVVTLNVIYPKAYRK